jgi:lysophospholipase L1-like esterase
VRLALCAALASLIALTASADESDFGRSALIGGESLGPFFDKLEAGPHPGGRPINILQIGDSHSANDNVSGGWRELLQAHYGNGGRGEMMPGKPFDGYTTRGVTVEQSAGWLTQNIFDAPFRELQQHALFGAAGYRQTAEAAGARLTMSADTPEFTFNRFVVCAVNGPGAGSYSIQLGAAVTRVNLDAPTTKVGCATVRSDRRESVAEVNVESGPVTITSWGSFADNGGVTVSNFGVVGTQIKNYEITDDAAVREELAAYAPDLIVVEFGTNDGFVGHFEPEDYELTLRGQIARLKRLSNNTPILLLGAPDADTDRTALADNAQADASTPRPGPGFWYPPPALAAVREIQRRVARSMGIAFWDWSSRMGGPGTADRWANADPPLIRKDRVHYTATGGRRVASLLDADFEAAKAAYILSAH